MKQFFKYVLATITGVTLLGFIFFLILFSMAVNSGKNQKVTVKDNSILHLKLNYQIFDKPKSDPFDLFTASLMGEFVKPVGLYDIVTSIEHAKTDEKIKGIFLDLSTIGAGYAKLSEIRDALEDFKSSGKFIYTYGEVFYNQTYYFGSVADSIFLNPSGTMLYNGMAADVTFMKETLKKMGVEMQVIKRGKFKGAVEPFVLDSLSPANRKQITDYVNSIYNTFTSKISNSRGVGIDELMDIADSARVRTSENAITYKLVDKLIYRDEVMAILKNASGTDKDEPQFISLAKYNRHVNPKSEPNTKPKVAIIYADGSIVSGNGQAEEIGSDKFAKAVKKARVDENVKAVVLRVNSPGGSALASDVIWRETKLLRAEKPLIVSMGDVAASGGYYISCMGEKILASPSTITGSIGVFGLYPNAEELMGDLGLHTDVVKTGELADFGRIDRPLTSEETKILDALVGQIYDQFLNRVETGRNLDRAHLDTIAEGRVWTGEYAKRHGLIDEYGGLVDAVELAAEAANITDYDVKNYPKSDNPFEDLLYELGGVSLKDRWVKQELGEYYTVYNKIKKLKNLSGIQMVMPYDINLN